MQEYLRDDYSITANDLADTLGISASALTAIFKKMNIQFAPSPSARVKKIPPAEVRRIFEARGYQYPKVAIKEAVFVCKGGTGKTTTALNYAIRASSYGYRVLLIDADPQGNGSKAALKYFDPKQPDNTDLYLLEVTPETPVLLDIVKKEVKAKDAIIEIAPFFHLIPSTNMNSTLENFLRTQSYNAARPIRELSKAVEGDYDILVFDCGPTLSTVNAAIVASVSNIIMPINGDSFSESAIKDTLSEIKRIQEDFNCKVETKLLFTRYDEKENLTKKYLGDFVNAFSEIMFATVIKQNSDIKAAISRGVCLYDLPRSCQGREDYDHFTKESLKIDAKGLRLRSPKNSTAKELKLRTAKRKTSEMEAR